MEMLRNIMNRARQLGLQPGGASLGVGSIGNSGAGAGSNALAPRVLPHDEAPINAPQGAMDALDGTGQFDKRTMNILKRPNQ
jgi:hypothetical protein